MENAQLVCPQCHQPILPEYYFCPNCGKNLKEKEVPVSVWAQVGVYLVSVFLPPLGLWPGIKYVMKPNKQAKLVGWIAIGLTIISTIVTLWLTYGVFQNYLNVLKSAYSFTY